MAFATKNGLTLSAAKKWAAKVLEEAEDKQVKLDIAGSMLVFSSLGRVKGSASVFLPGVQSSEQHSQFPGTAVFEWGDTDSKAREFNRRRLDAKAKPVSAEEQDALIAERKSALLGEGIELFDDWFVRQARNSSSKALNVQFVQEAPVSAHEVEMHVEPGTSSAPVPHESIRRLELDSEEDDDGKHRMGGGSYLDYLRRQVLAHLPRENVHFIDPRVLGDAEDQNLPKALHGSFQASEQLPKSQEAVELEGRGADWAKPAAEGEPCRDGTEFSPLPSWEAFFGGAADLLYYAGHVKADFAPFLAGCVGSAEKLRRFYEALYLGTVPEAIAEIQLNDNTRPLACVRSLAYQPPEPGAALLRRPMGHCSDRRKLLPVRAAPVDRYLKARGFNPPRTWSSGLAEQLRRKGAEQFVIAAQTFYRSAVDRMLADPKVADDEGDNFVAWLRACHPDIYYDIDSNDPNKLNRCHWAQSESHPKSKEHRYNLKDIRIPGFEAAFAEVIRSRPSTQASSSREQVLAKILVDAFQLRLVDLSMILKTANIVMATPKGGRVVVVQYAGADHIRSVVKFWRSQGFRLRGSVGKDSYEDDEPRVLALPSYLHDFTSLFSHSTSESGAGTKKTKS
jgi:hypothetical protein